jgi:glycosyltransferase involved in cell wall biosynthesis
MPARPDIAQPHSDRRPPAMTTTMLVIPCYNEAKRLDGGQILAYAEAQPDVRFVFVNDGSTDGTPGILDVLVARLPERLGVLHLEANAGKAEAVRRGLQYANETEADIVGFWDADLSTGLDEIARFLEVLAVRDDVEMVFGSRVNLLGRQVRRKLSRHYIGRVFATTASWALHLPIYDTQCGAKMFRVTDELRSVLESPFMSRWIFDVEMIARFIEGRRGTDKPAVDTIIYEIPLMAWYDVAGSKLRPRDLFVVAGDMVRIWWRYLR